MPVNPEITIAPAGRDGCELRIFRRHADGSTSPVSLTDPDIVRDPYSFYRRLRAITPMFRCPELFGGAWVFMDYADLTALFRNADCLSNHKFRGIVDDLPPPERKQFERLLSLHSRWMFFFDGAKHTRVRKLMAKGFVAQKRERMAGFAHQQASRLVRSLGRRDRADLVEEYARSIPLFTVGRMLGIGEEDMDMFSRWIGDLAAYMGSEKPRIEVISMAQQSLSDLEEYFRALIIERRKRPVADDLLSLLIAAEEEGETLSKEELLAQCSFLSFTGNETTKNLISNSIYCLLAHPEQKALLQADISLTPQAIEETLRFECPVQFISRRVKRPFEYRSAQLQRGEYVILLIGAANRDPRRFADPDRLDIERKEARHISFGEGPHACLGQGLARIEAEIAVAEFFSHFPLAALAAHGAMEWNGNPGLRGLKYLNVDLH